MSRVGDIMATLVGVAETGAGEATKANTEVRIEVTINGLSRFALIRLKRA